MIDTFTEKSSLPALEPEYNEVTRPRRIRRASVDGVTVESVERTLRQLFLGQSREWLRVNAGWRASTYGEGVLAGYMHVQRSSGGREHPLATYLSQSAMLVLDDQWIVVGVQRNEDCYLAEGGVTVCRNATDATRQLGLLISDWDAHYAVEDEDEGSRW